MKAMILAAGLGTRMRHLVATTPKPLLKLHNIPLIEYNLRALAAANITDLVINTHYLAASITDYLGDGRQFDVNIQYSHEPKLLDTGFGIKTALSLLGNDPFLVISADIWTNFDFAKLPKSTKLAHLVLVPNPKYHPQGDFSLAGDIVTAPINNTFTYANIAILHPSIFDNSPTQPFPLTTTLNNAIADQQVTGEIFHGHWFNIGTPEELQLATVALS